MFPVNSKSRKLVNASTIQTYFIHDIGNNGYHTRHLPFDRLTGRIRELHLKEVAIVCFSTFSVVSYEGAV